MLQHLKILRNGTLLLTALTCLAGCHHPYSVPESPMPPNTILLSQVMRQVSSHTDVAAAVAAALASTSHDAAAKRGPTLMTPALIDDLRKRILGKDWQGLDRFPGYTMRELNPSVQALAEAAARHAKAQPPTSPSHLLDLGPYALDRAQTVALDNPSTLPGYVIGGPGSENPIMDLGNGLIRGDGPGPLADHHAESQRLADVLNRLAANALPNARPFAATLHGHIATTPRQLMVLLEDAGFQVTVTDSRYFANFAHLHFQPTPGAPAQDVMMPFWINSGLTVPHAKGRRLLLPVSHAELEWHIRPPATSAQNVLFADVSFYFSIDGKAQWRTMDTQDQAWVLGRNAHTYTGFDALEATRLSGLLLLAYAHLHATHPQLPFGGYYELGVCQDGVSAVELHLTGHVTLFPNTADHALFIDPRDAEINALIAAVPSDRNNSAPSPERVFGSLPVLPVPNLSGPGPEPTAFDTVTIPGLREDLTAAYAAWKTGEASSANRLVTPRTLVALLALLTAGFLAFTFAISRRRSHARPR